MTESHVAPIRLATCVSVHHLLLTPYILGVVENSWSFFKIFVLPQASYSLWNHISPDPLHVEATSIDGSISFFLAVCLRAHEGWFLVPCFIYTLFFNNILLCLIFYYLFFESPECKLTESLVASQPPRYMRLRPSSFTCSVYIRRILRTHEVFMLHFCYFCSLFSIGNLAIHSDWQGYQRRSFPDTSLPVSTFVIFYW